MPYHQPASAVLPEKVIGSANVPSGYQRAINLNVDIFMDNHINSVNGQRLTSPQGKQIGYFIGAIGLCPYLRCNVATYGCGTRAFTIGFAPAATGRSQ